MRVHVTKQWLTQSGERYCALVRQDTGIPHYHATLYVTSQVRNASLSLSAMEQTCQAINVLLEFCQESQLDLEERFLQRSFLLYTGLTRGVEQVVLISDLNAACAAILAPTTATKRYVNLPRLLDLAFGHAQSGSL